jgi:hypothetical protein
MADFPLYNKGFWRTEKYAEQILFSTLPASVSTFLRQEAEIRRLEVGSRVDMCAANVLLDGTLERCSLTCS